MQNRKRFIVFGVSTALLFTVFRFFAGEKKKTKTVKMLTEDGKLVEVELSKLSSKRKKIRDDEIHTWIKRKSI